MCKCPTLRCTLVWDYPAAGSARAGSARLNSLSSDSALVRSHRIWAVRADLHRRLGHTVAALDDYQRALELVRNDVERRYLTDARARLAAGSWHQQDT